MRATGATKRRVTLLESHDAAMPMTWGVISPVLLIPSSTEEWPEWKCRDILLHELAHIERFDCLTQMVARLACAAYWFNPLAWMAAHRMRVERELACDDRVINNGSRPSEYATHLLDVALSLRPARATAQAAIAMARPSQLSGRLMAVLDRERNRRKASPRFRAAVGAATLGVLLPVASFSPFVTDATAAPFAPTLRSPVSGDTRLFDEGTAATTRQTSVSFDSTAAPAPPAPVASGFVVATTSGATSSIVTTSSAAGF
jgi:beta-lactamase regulating signal transducer with metallopeptidase domain